jgi:hypothetical protein
MGPLTEKIVNPDEVCFRLLRGDDVPATNPFKLAYRFGLQDTKQDILAGERQPDGVIAFNFSLQAKNGKDPEHPVFTGRFASGPVNDRFVYLSWWAIERGDYINRVKARLATIDWKMVRASQEQARPITADMTGWLPGDARKHVTWYLD